MKKIIILLLSCILYPLQAQISHGGVPLFLFQAENNGLRSPASVDNSFFIEMPRFDLDSILAEDKLNEMNMRSSFQFANKFFTSIERGKSGHNFTLADGTKVWQVGIRSEGAYSINVLFSEFHIPEGGKLFLYSSNQSHVIGSFTSENNSEDNLLPTAPISGDEIIIEYSEPADAAFEGVLKISEVNHDYRGILRMEPYNVNNPTYKCMQDILCSAAKDSKIKNSTVLLIINGVTLCSGSMINNTSNDMTPYLLTGMHCFNKSTPIHYPLEHYAEKAGTIVTFFNYNRPVCEKMMRGVEEMSVAGAQVRTIIEPLDIALLELNDTPPDYYQAYYAGWNINTNGGSQPYTNIHHPMGDVKKYGMANKPVSLSSLSFDLFRSNSFWRIPGWTDGSTAGGSSGSPLFDSENLIIGALTGGSSTCVGTAPSGQSDYFSALYLGWEYGGDSLQLKKWLDKGNTGLKKCLGFDPIPVDTPFVRLSNANYNNGDQLATTKRNDGVTYLFGSNTMSTVEYAEKFKNNQEAEIYGVFILNPAISYPSGINIYVYNEVGNKPGTKIATAYFRPQYTNYSANFSNINKTMSSQASESYIPFSTEIPVNGNFFIGYEVPANNSFLIYNTIFGGPKFTTAWIRDPLNGWAPSDSLILAQPLNTALAIQALVRRGVKETPTKLSYVHKDPIHLQFEHVLMIECEAEVSGIVRFYSITGQCLQQTSFKGPSTISPPLGLKNTLGIVQLRTNDDVQTIKVVF